MLLCRIERLNSCSLWVHRIKRLPVDRIDIIQQKVWQFVRPITFRLKRYKSVFLVRPNSSTVLTLRKGITLLGRRLLTDPIGENPFLAFRIGLKDFDFYCVPRCVGMDLGWQSRIIMDKTGAISIAFLRFLKVAARNSGQKGIFSGRFVEAVATMTKFLPNGGNMSIELNRFRVALSWPQKVLQFVRIRFDSFRRTHDILKA